jgi:predicted nucleic acid-binding protein
MARKYVLDTNLYIDAIRNSLKEQALEGFLERNAPMTYMVNDILIAITCRENGLTLLTANEDFNAYGYLGRNLGQPAALSQVI